MKKILPQLLFLFSSIVYSQLSKERALILNATIKNEAQKLKNKIVEIEEKNKKQVAQYLLKNPNTPNPEKIQFIIDDNPYYYDNDNAVSSQYIRANTLYPGGTLNINATGSNIMVGVWDDANNKTRETHIEFGGRVNVVNNFTTLSQHSTHVTGTILASGVSTTRRGIAYQATAETYDFNSDSSEMINFASQGFLVSNHSYGLIASGLSNYQFGYYSSQSATMDDIMFTFPYYQIVKSAGNNRNETTLNQVVLKGGYDLLTGMSCSKNVLTIGAIQNFTDDSYTPENVNISTFSNFGPPDDGRVKPDLVAKGVGISSTIQTSDSAYGVLQGTSMSAPAITGLIALLQDHYNNLNSGSYMRSATVRGLLCQSVREVNDPGPDYAFGWGLADGFNAAQVITSKGITSLLEERNLSQGQVYNFNFTINNPQNINVVISWTDPAGTVGSTSVDNRTPKLVNNLDLKILKDGITYYPWKLDPESVFDPATNNSDNNVDNIEKVEIFNAQPGTYTIQVSHKGNLLGGSQDYSLIASSTNGLTLNSEDFIADNNFFVYPNPAKTLINFINPKNIDLDRITILDISGKKVYEDKENLSETNKIIDVSGLTSGIYFIKFDSQNNSFVRKFIKE